MASKILRTPSSWTDRSIEAFAQELMASKDYPDPVVLDFRDTQWVNPFPALVAAEVICHVRDYRRDRDLRMQWHRVTDSPWQGNALTYLGHMGFFQRAHMDYGKKPGEARGSNRYLPFTVVRPSGGLKDRGYGALQSQIKDESKRLAAMIHHDDFVQDMLGYCLREIIRNVFEHAETNECVLVAQKYSTDVVEIGIADRGRGVPASMGERFSFTSPHEALLESLEPGVTRVPDPGDRHWDNSGFGLYVLSTLGLARGQFRLVSHGAAVRTSEESLVGGDATFPGTAVKLRLSLRDAEYFPNQLHQIVEEGERLAGHSARASGSSKRLS